MAGQKITRQQLKHIKDNYPEESELENLLFEAVINGASFSKIVKGQIESLKGFTRKGKGSLTWGLFYKYLETPSKAFPEGKREALTHAREQYQIQKAQDLAAETVEIADSTDLDNESINKSKLMIDSRKWLAGSYNAQFKAGTGNQVQVNISTNDLHLEALKKV